MRGQNAFLYGFSDFDNTGISEMCDRYDLVSRLASGPCPRTQCRWSRKRRGKEVTVQTHGKDKYGRTIADVLLTRRLERQSRAGQRRLVLVVPEVCAREYYATEVRSRGTRIEDGAMVRPSSRTAVGVEKEKIAEIPPVNLGGSLSTPPCYPPCWCARVHAGGYRMEH